MSAVPTTPESHFDGERVTVIRPTRGWAALNLRELWDYRELLYFLIWR
ncbi:MAG: lipopolysaccharide transport system permease protein, partial [Gaiellaceae bacterium]|nr:lipopolysaccharide transport system permease protein [Gaiellaceae bacterium]